MLNDIYTSNSTFLKAADLQGKKPVVVIESATVKENNYPEGTKKQIVLGFVGTDKVLGLNFTNASAIAGLIGTEDFNQWVGVAIRLYEDKTKNSQGVVVPCIRVFPELPQDPVAAPQRPQPPAPPVQQGGLNPSFANRADDDIPF